MQICVVLNDDDFKCIDYDKCVVETKSGRIRWWELLQQQRNRMYDFV